MSNWGIKVSEPGFDITENNPRKLRFSSGWQLWKQQATGTFTGTTPANGGSVTYSFTKSHSLGYAPATVIYWSIDGGATYHIAGGRATTLWAEKFYVLAGSTSSEIIVKVDFYNGGIASPQYDFIFRYSAYLDPSS